MESLRELADRAGSGLAWGSDAVGTGCGHGEVPLDPVGKGDGLEEEAFGLGGRRFHLK